MSALNGHVTSVVKSIDAATAANNETMDIGGQINAGRNDPPGHQPARAGKKGEQFCRDFCKMDPVKRECRDNNDERTLRRNIPCHYDALNEHNFVAKRITTESMLPTLKPTEVVGIIMAHFNYQDLFLDAVTVDLESFCSSKIDILGIENALIDDGHNVEDKFPEVCKCFFTDPVEKKT